MSKTIVKTAVLPAPSLVLDGNAAEIRQRSKRVVADVIEIGRLLVQSKELLEKLGGLTWSAWLEKEFDWSDQTAYRFVHLYRLSSDARLHTCVESDLPLRVLYQLAAPKAKAAREEVAERIEVGGTPSRTVVNDAIAKAKGKIASSKTESEAADVSDQDEDPAIAQHRAAMAALAAQSESESPTDTPALTNVPESIDTKPRAKKSATASESETLIVHWRRETRESRMAFLDDAGAAEILAAVSPEFSKQLQARFSASTKRRKNIALAANAVDGMRGTNSRH